MQMEQFRSSRQAKIESIPKPLSNPVWGTTLVRQIINIIIASRISIAVSRIEVKCTMGGGHGVSLRAIHRQVEATSVWYT